MPKKLVFLLILLTTLASLDARADVQNVDFREFVNQGSDLARKGDWNRSELNYLKAVESPFPEQRVLAYEGLAGLYSKLKLSKKVESIKKKLKYEKDFIEKLVPTDPSFYINYTARKGDTYASIAAREGVSLEWLKRANQNKTLIEGKTILLPFLRYSIYVNKKNLTMEWRRGDEILKIYPVAIGKKETATPEGEFTIVSKVKNPVWYYLKVQIPPDSPKNMLGPRWLGLNVKGYGIHGTRNSRSIGNAVSHGCVRMLNRDVQELFEWIPVGTQVTIKN